MEIKIFLQMLLKRWWIIFLMLAVSLLGTVWFTELQIPIYASAETYVVSPSPSILDGTGFLSGLSILGGQPAVTNTYASIAASSFVKQQASAILGLTEGQSDSLTVFSRVRTGTNIIEITVEGDSPLLVQTFTAKIGQSTIEYISRLDGVYDLKLLDGAASPEKPIRPNKKLNVIIGATLGLILGGGLAFLLSLNEY